MTDLEEKFAPFACTACGWTDDLWIPGDKPATDRVDNWTCTGCGQEGMTMIRLHGVLDLRWPKRMREVILEWYKPDPEFPEHAELDLEGTAVALLAVERARLAGEYPGYG